MVNASNKTPVDRLKETGIIPRAQIALLRELKRLKNRSTLSDFSSTITEPSSTAASLEGLLGSERISRLSDAISNLPEANVFSVLQKFDRIKLNDEHLHTRMIRFLLDPTARHGLGDAFFKSLIGEVRFYRDGQLTDEINPKDTFHSVKVSPKEIRLDPDNQVDLLATCERPKFVVFVENKVNWRERPNQLKDYWKRVKDEYNDRPIAGVFLTPEGRKPEQAGPYKDRYLALSYEKLGELLSEAIKNAKASVDGHALGVATQYHLALGEFFVENAKLKTLAWTLYQEFPSALYYLARSEREQIAPWQQITGLLRKLIEDEIGLQYIPWDLKRTAQEFAVESAELEAGQLVWEGEMWFVPKDWEKRKALRRAKTHDANGRLLLMGFERAWGSDCKDLYIFLASPPGSDSNKVKTILGALRKSNISAKQETSGDGDWTYLWTRTLATQGDLRDKDRDHVFEKIRGTWRTFLTRDLPKIRSAVEQVPFIKSS